MVDSRLTRVIVFLLRDFSKPVTLSDIAGEARLSRSHTAHLFKRDLCSSPMRILAAIRLLRAQQLVETTQLSIKRDWGARWASRREPFRTQVQGHSRLITSPVPQTWRADFDTGELAFGKEDDVWFEVSETWDRFLSPINGARLKPIEPTQWTSTICDEAGLTTNKLDISALFAGTVVALRTNRGGCTRIRVMAAAGPSPGTIVVQYETWR